MLVGSLAPTLCLAGCCCYCCVASGGTPGSLLAAAAIAYRTRSPDQINHVRSPVVENGRPSPWPWHHHHPSRLSFPSPSLRACPVCAGCLPAWPRLALPCLSASGRTCARDGCWSLTIHCSPACLVDNAPHPFVPSTCRCRRPSAFPVRPSPSPLSPLSALALRRSHCRCCQLLSHTP